MSVSHLVKQLVWVPYTVAIAVTIHSHSMYTLYAYVHCAVGAPFVSAVQEGFRGMRHGAHDALNSTAAGAVTGAGLVRLVGELMLLVVVLLVVVLR